MNAHLDVLVIFGVDGLPRFRVNHLYRALRLQLPHKFLLVNITAAIGVGTVAKLNRLIKGLGFGVWGSGLTVSSHVGKHLLRKSR